MIIVTRPSPYGEELAQLCHEAGLVAKHLPLFNITLGHDITDLQNQLNQLEVGDMVIAVSPQVIDMLKKSDLTFKFPAHAHYFSVGARTANEFQMLINQPVLFPTEDESSEGLISFIEKNCHPVAGRSALILCGNVGRDIIKNYLLSNGMLVKKINCYNRIAITYPNTILKNNIAQQQIIVTSVEHLQQLEKYIQDEHKTVARLIVSHPRIANEAQLHGWQYITITNSANNKNLVKTAITLCHNKDIE